MTAGFTSASITYDWDTDAANRILYPEFYGFISNMPTKRAATFFLMCILPVFQLMIKAATVALSLIIASKALLIVIVTDIVLFMAYKVSRNDFFIWVPLEGSRKYLVSFIFR